MALPDVIEVLKGASTCNVCDALELVGETPGSGVIRGIRRMNAPADVMVGIATTATFRSSASRPSGTPNVAIEAQLERLSGLSGPGIVVFQDLDDPWYGATAGEIRCRFYQLAGAVGFVTNGAVRDIDGLNQIGMPVYASDVTCSHGHHYVPDLDVVVTIGGVRVVPGDIIHGDSNGLVVISQHIAEEVSVVLRDVVEAENLLFSSLRSASMTSSLDARRHYKVTLDRLRARAHGS